MQRGGPGSNRRSNLARLTPAKPPAGITTLSGSINLKKRLEFAEDGIVISHRLPAVCFTCGWSVKFLSTAR